ncbi:MAG: hypothetical protein HQM08_12045 [Candidatus Riflebacteria bacterium]|nr:hypothetical protein [Candidatus Riflebacteria bacterium]
MSKKCSISYGILTFCFLWLLTILPSYSDQTASSASQTSIERNQIATLTTTQVNSDEQTNPDDQAASSPKRITKFGKVEQSWGLRYFHSSGYVDFVEPRISFIKKKAQQSETIEYGWRPMLIQNMPNKERIDRVQFTFNHYFFTSPKKNVFYGAGVGGNFIFFSQSLKNWAHDRNINLKDGINGLGRIFLGCKVGEFKLFKTVYPLVIRVDAAFSPPYKFGGTLGKAGDQIKLTEVYGGLGFSIE